MSSCCSPKFTPNLFVSLIISALIIFLYYLLQPIFFFSISPSSSLLAIFIFGIIAGVSTCSPLTGSLFLSFLPQKKSALIFLVSRLITFSLGGLTLGLFSFSLPVFVPLLLSLLLSLFFLKIIKLPSFNLSKSSPLIAGMLTFFLPCGFTLSAQTLALSQSTPLNSFLILFFFCLGTIFPLLFLFFTPKISPNQKLSAYFYQIIGLLLLTYSLKSLLSPLTTIVFAKTSPPETTLNMDVLAASYSPNHFTVKANSQVTWNITAKDYSSCTDTIIQKTLLSAPLKLQPYSTTTVNFTAPSKPGSYRFSCSMGMVNGIIEVVN